MTNNEEMAVELKRIANALERIIAAIEHMAPPPPTNGSIRNLQKPVKVFHGDMRNKDARY